MAFQRVPQFASASGNARRLRILVVEDDPIIALGLEALVADLGHSVVSTADTAEDAVDAAALHRPDLVLMDVNLRGKRDGVSAAREIKEQFGTPVMFLTAYSDRETMDRVTEVAPLGVVSKPVFRDRLQSALLGATDRLAQATPHSRRVTA